MGTKTLLTLQEFERLPEDGMLHELNQGELVSVPPPKLKHDLVQLRLLEELIVYSKTHPGCGRASQPTGCLLSKEPPTIRVPDVCFFRPGRLSAGTPTGWFEGAPDLAIEVVSPSETAKDLREKVRQYLKAGSGEVWVVYPDARTIDVFRNDGSVTALDDSQTLDSPALLPGWSIPVREIFD